MKEKRTGIIFNTQKFSIHDGGGIRTLIFMKGCPLRCIWCSNPESQRPEPEITDVKTNCIGCGDCVCVCPKEAVNPLNFQIDRGKCDACGLCAKSCYAQAKKLTGQVVTVEELVNIAVKDQVIYRNSGGGVTVGGGEPLTQPDFVYEFLRACSMRNIHTAIETCGFGDWSEVEKVFHQADQILFDLKCMDEEKHRAYTGVSNKSILRNAEKAAASGKEIRFRVPVIPGVNDGENIRQTGAFVRGLQRQNSQVKVELLPYHNFGKDKYKWLGRKYDLGSLERMEKEELGRYYKVLEELGCNVVY
ncbi:glycyl-radical enzyme activating protein [Eubacteriales bacterium DFI.9.88]|nr:glycyl-radical enzyme activating protein [Anaerovorax odorimutans]MDE8732405.1 glycyl-radical enzyme activating protein [Eubacteriales bacterium DFI.9.88]